MGDLRQEVRQVLVETSFGGHAGCPSTTGEVGRDGLSQDGHLHRRQRVVQAGLGGAQRDADGSRDFGQRHAEEVVQDDDRAMPRIEARECPLEHVAIGELAGQVGRGRHVDGCQLDLDDATSTSPHLVETGIDDQSVQPGVEPVRVAQAREIAPGADVRVLDRVACELVVSDDQTSDRVQPHEGQVDERGEGVMIAFPSLLDESSLVHVRLGCWHGHCGRASHGMARR